jgi:predicted metal-dependent peptidase
MAANDDRLARGTMQLAIQRLIARNPLIGGLAASWSVSVDPEIVTLGIGMGAENLELIINPAFVLNCPLDQLAGLVHHECRHLIFNHVFMEPENYPNAEALLIAQETVANEGLAKPLPRGSMLLRHYPLLNRGQDTETRYETLARDRRRKRTLFKGCIDSGPLSNVSSKHRSRPVAPPSVIPDSIAHGAVTASHAHWEEIRLQDSLAKSTISASINGMLAEKTSLSDHEMDLVREVARTCRAEPGSLICRLSKGLTSRKLDWRTLLRRYVGRLLERDLSYMWPPRRFPHLLGIVPGARRIPGKPKVLAVIDTSASMSDSELAAISNELAHVSRTCNMWVVECDSAIHNMYRYKNPITQVAGRGGTSFLPPLARSFLMKTQADVVIFFTDGFGPVPEKKPQVKVLWVLTKGGKRPSEWGDVVHMYQKPQETDENVGFGFGILE